MSNMLRTLFLIITAVSLAGCSTFVGKDNFVKKRETEYLRSESVSPLQVPPGVAKTGVSDDYAIPPLSGQRITEQTSLIPPNSLTQKVVRGEVSAKTLAQESTKSTRVASKISNAVDPELSLNQTIDQVWSAVGSGLKQAGYMIANENKASGIYYLLDTLSTDGKVKRETSIYQLHLHDTQNGAIVNVTDNEGKKIDAVIAQRILSDLNKALTGKTSSSFSRWLKSTF